MSNLRPLSLLTPDERICRDLKARSLAFFVEQLPAYVSKQLIGELKQVAIDNGNANVRICLHNGPQMAHQDMIILEHGGNYFPPHRHPGKAETFSVLEGVLGLVSYDEEGAVVDAQAVGVGEIYRLAIPHYHLVTPLTPIVIYHESKPGPFLGADDLILPRWVPAADDKAGIDRLMNSALEMLRR